MAKAHLTVTGKNFNLTEFVNDHRSTLDYKFFTAAAPLPIKWTDDFEQKIEAWGCEFQPHVTVIHEMRPLQHPKDFSLDEIVYELNWTMPSSTTTPPNRWMETASQLYGVQMLLEFINGDRITILECNSKGEVVLDKELERSAADEFYNLQYRVHGFNRIYRPVTEKDLKAYINDLRLYDGYTIDNLATVLIDALTEEELRLTLHKYANDVRKKQEAERQAKWEETKRNDPYWSHHYKKQSALVNYQVNRKAAGDKGVEALAEFEVRHQDLVCSTGSDKGLTTDYAQMAKNLYYNINIREFLDCITLEGDALRTVEFRKALARVKKNWKDRERKAAKREAEREAAKAPTETPKINLLGNVNNGNFSLNNLLSAEAESLKGDK